jgi:plasmid stability protein
MPALYLADVPAEVVDQLRQLATAHQTTVETEAIALLHRQLHAQSPRRSQAELLAELRRRSYTPPPGTPDSVTLLAEDRER